MTRGGEACNDKSTSEYLPKSSLNRSVPRLAQRRFRVNHMRPPICGPSVLPTSAKAVITMRDMRTFRPLLPRRAADPTRDSLVPEHSMAPHPTPPTSRPVTAPIEASVVNSAVYRDGVRIGSPSNLAEALRSLPDAASMASVSTMAFMMAAKSACSTIR